MGERWAGGATVLGSAGKGMPPLAAFFLLGFQPIDPTIFHTFADGTGDTIIDRGWRDCINNNEKEVPGCVVGCLKVCNGPGNRDVNAEPWDWGSALTHTLQLATTASDNVDHMCSAAVVITTNTFSGKVGRGRDRGAGFEVR